MPLSKPVRESTELQKIMEFQMPALRRGTEQVVVDFLDSVRKSKNHFRAAETTRVQTGLDQLESQSVEEEIEKKMLEKLKPIQESAFQEAHQLGLIEGKREAFASASAEIAESLRNMSDFLESMKTLKRELYQQNESHLIRLLLSIASKIAFHDVQTHEEGLKKLLLASLEEAQADEKVTVRLSPSHLNFFEELQKQNDFELEILKKAKFLADENLSPGGCIIETNYGEIDAQIEQRVEKLFASFEEVIFPTKSELKSA